MRPADRPSIESAYSAAVFHTPCPTPPPTQANSILVAGHDTTSFMLTSTLYYVAMHPGVKAKVFAEIERFGRARKVTYEDMDKFPYLEASNHYCAAPGRSIRYASIPLSLLFVGGPRCRGALGSVI